MSTEGYASPEELEDRSEARMRLLSEIEDLEQEIEDLEGELSNKHSELEET